MISYGQSEVRPKPLAACDRLTERTAIFSCSAHRQVDKRVAGGAARPLPAPVTRLYYLNEFGQEGSFSADEELLDQLQEASLVRLTKSLLRFHPVSSSSDAPPLTNPERFPFVHRQFTPWGPFIRPFAQSWWRTVSGRRYEQANAERCVIMRRAIFVVYWTSKYLQTHCSSHHLVSTPGADSERSDGSRNIRHGCARRCQRHL